MANYTPTFTKPYPSGWVDKPSKTTPATAAIMNSYDTAIAALEAYLRDNAIDTVSVSVEQFPSDGRQWIGTITVGSDQYRIYMPSLKYENSVSDGIKIGTITLGDQSFDVYAPTSSTGGSTVSVVPKTLTGTNIAEITVDGTTYQLYAPTSGGGSGSTVTAEATLTEGTQIGKITIDGVETILYAPTASQITVDSELSATSENAIQNKAVDAAVKNLQQQIDAGGAGGSVTVDSALSATSENPVQNKVVTAELNKKIETLDDESQAPDVVNFDLDSELSLTSVKGVQNKAIAEEFQKYANGTKVVAKATESETAKTASNAEKVNGHTVGTDVPSNAVFTDTVYDDSTVKASIQNIVNGTTQVGSATKATQDAKGNVIDTTYAKKTEVPQGTVVDDALSSTSINPVQNKVVKAEFGKLNSNLDKQGYGENTGSGNLFREEYKNNSLYVKKSQYQSYLKTNIKGITKLYATVKLKGTSQSNYSCSIGNTNILADKRFLNYGNISIQEYDFGVGDDVYIHIACNSGVDVNTFFENYEIIISDSTITSDTKYEPYIPSVKMLAEENAQQNDILSSLGKCKNLLKPTLQTTTQNGVTCTNNGDGTYTINGTNSSNGNTTFTIFFTVNYTGKAKVLGCPVNNYVAMLQVQYDGTWGNSAVWDIGKGSIVENASKIGGMAILISGGKTVNNLVFKPMITTNLNATYDDFVPYTGEGETLTHDVAELKNDLSNLKDGTTSAAKAVADEDGNNIKSTYATKAEIPSTPSSLYETVNVDIVTDLFAKSDTQYYVNCERVGNICTLSFWLKATASVDYKDRHELFDIDKIPKNNLTIGFCVVNFNYSVSNTANIAYNYINSISVEEDYNAILKRNISKVYLLPYRTGGNILSSGYEIIGQISWAVEV